MNAKLLLVDDEPAVLVCVSTALSRFGFSVTTAASGEAALAELEKQAFDLVITDYRMPGVNGAAVIAAARGQPQEPAVILITGLSEELPASLRVGPDAVRVLTKPFLLAQLRAAAEEALVARAAVPV